MKFGTDGLRGRADSELTPDVAYALGVAAADTLGTVEYLIGVDGRESGPALASALAYGLEHGGATVRLVGLVPTPGLAVIAAQRGVAAAMISASHNPYFDNGIKLFAPGGRKLSDDVQNRVQAALDHHRALGLVLPAGAQHPVDPLDHVTAVSEYEAALLASLEPQALAGLRVVLDCANGAASELAAAVYESAGAEVVEVVHNTPDGRNINAGCGSTAMESLQAAVVASGARLGVAFDGDGDRALFVDHLGRRVDGDAVMLVCTDLLRREGALDGNAVVATVMSNIGLELALKERGVGLVRCAVGDKYVMEEMLKRGLALGGEQSGHVIFARHLFTGDGIATALQVLRAIITTGEELATLAAALTSYPQVLVNVRVKVRTDVSTVPAVANAMQAVEARLAGQGRLLVRYSGTEPLLRIMLEGKDQGEISAWANEIADAVRATLA